jgi:chemotaxis signal transduction protein
VVEAKGIQTALFLDRVGDIIFAENKNLQKVTGEESAIPSQFLKGYFLPQEEKPKILIYLDLEQLLSSEKLAAGFKEG